MKLRTTFLAALVVIVYITIVVAMIPFVFRDTGEVFAIRAWQVAGGGFAVATALALACIIHAIATHKGSLADPVKARGLYRQVMAIKLVLIPFFLFAALVGAYCVYFMLIGAVLPLAGLVIIPTALFIIIVGSLWCWFLVYATSAYSISAILIQYKKRYIKLGLCVLFIVLQLIPIADVISYIFIATSFAKRDKLH